MKTLNLVVLRDAYLAMRSHNKGSGNAWIAKTICVLAPLVAIHRLLETQLEAFEEARPITFWGVFWLLLALYSFFIDVLFYSFWYLRKIQGKEVVSESGFAAEPIRVENKYGNRAIYTLYFSGTLLRIFFDLGFISENLGIYLFVFLALTVLIFVNSINKRRT